MEYETADGSQFSLLEIFSDPDGEPRFEYTSVTALVQGEAYAGKVNQHMEDVDEIEAMSCLALVPVESIYPLCPDDFTRASKTGDCYLKSPTFTYEDGLLGCTFVADCLLNEATALEKLRKHPHPNIAKYHGCVVKDGRVTQLCLERYPRSLAAAEPDLSEREVDHILQGVAAGMKHLHDLGLAHNDICLENVCLQDDGIPVLVDFDSCLSFGEKLMKGTAGDGEPTSSIKNDLDGLDRLADLLEGAEQP